MSIVHRNISRLAIVALVAVLGAAVIGAGNDEKKALNLPEGVEDRTGIQDEMRIMAKVLEESLNKSGVPNLSLAAYHSPFDSRIDYQYVPTVGLVYTIEVGFPLIEPPAREDEGTKENEEEQESGDLWEKHEKGAVKIGRGNRGTRDAKLCATHYIKGFPHLPFAKEKTAGMTYEVFGDQFGFPYSSRKIDLLKNALITTLAQYGHRLESLSDDENILIVAKGDRGADSQTAYSAAARKNMSNAVRRAMAALPSHASPAFPPPFIATDEKFDSGTKRTTVRVGKDRRSKLEDAEKNLKNLRMMQRELKAQKAAADGTLEAGKELESLEKALNVETAELMKRQAELESEASRLAASAANLALSNPRDSSDKILRILRTTNNKAAIANQALTLTFKKSDLKAPTTLEALRKKVQEQLSVF